MTMSNLFSKMFSQPLAISESGARQLRSLSVQSRESLDPNKYGIDSDAWGNKWPKPYDINVSAQNVRVIPIQGPMTRGLGLFGQYYGMVDMDTVKRQIEDASADSSVDIIALHIQSPGGSAIGCYELADTLRDAAKAGKGTFAFSDEMMCSAAYFVASACEWVSSTPSAIVGSVGTLLQLVDDSEFWKKQGIEFIVLRSGKYKGAGIDGYTEDQMAELQSMVDAFGAQFRGFVSSRRGDVDVSNMEGQVFLGNAALSKKFVDNVSNNMIQALESYIGASNLT